MHVWQDDAVNADEQTAGTPWEEERLAYVIYHARVRPETSGGYR